MWTDRTVGAFAASETLVGLNPSEDEPPPAPSIVIGLGNDIASDDGVGIHVARILEDRLRERDDIDVIALPWAGFTLLDVLRDRRRAAIVDCLSTGDQPPGTVVRLSEQAYAGSVRLNSFHDISYPTVMALGRQMDWDMPADVAIWGIEAGHLGDFGEELSPAVADGAQRVIHEVILFLDAEDTQPDAQE